jgi:hypothetical protein
VHTMAAALGWLAAGSALKFYAHKTLMFDV